MFDDDDDAARRAKDANAIRGFWLDKLGDLDRPAEECFRPEQLAALPQIRHRSLVTGNIIPRRLGTPLHDLLYAVYLPRESRLCANDQALFTLPAGRTVLSVPLYVAPLMYTELRWADLTPGDRWGAEWAGLTDNADYGKLMRHSCKTIVLQFMPDAVPVVIYRGVLLAAAASVCYF